MCCRHTSARVCRRRPSHTFCGTYCRLWITCIHWASSTGLLYTHTPYALPRLPSTHCYHRGKVVTVMDLYLILIVKILLWFQSTSIVSLLACWKNFPCELRLKRMVSVSDRGVDMAYLCKHVCTWSLT